MEERAITLNLTEHQAVLLAMCVSTTAATAAGFDVRSQKLMEAFVKEAKSLMEIMNFLYEQVRGFPGVDDVERWLVG